MELNKKGSVLVFVLVFIAFAASTVLLIHERSTKSVSDVSEDFYENQANIYAMTAMTAISQVLEDDDSSFDSRYDDWNLIPLVEIPFGVISVSVKPVNAKISLNGMLDTDTAVAARYLEACTNLSDNLEVDSLECGVIKDYIDSDSELSDGGAENAQYELNGITIRTKNAPLESLYELRLLMNNNEEFSKIRDNLTVFNPEKAININFANAETISALLPELEPYAEEIVKYADSHEMKDASNIQEATDIPQDIYVAVLPYITVKSTLFYVKTEVTLNDVPHYYHALIKRSGSTAQIVKFLAGINGQYY
jgi:general secretion pathway protein K